MFPIRDTIQSDTFPIVNTILILINVIVFFFEISFIPDVNQFINAYGLVPGRYLNPAVGIRLFTSWQQNISLVTFMFLHGGLLHLIGNMWFLYLFGDNIEDRLGHIRYLAFYLLCGWASAFAQLLINSDSMVPIIGASGAIAGVMGAYMILFPRSRILTLVFIIIIPYFFEIPAVFFLAIWFGIQFLSASITGVHATGIAWWAHIGGFVSGIIFSGILLWIPRTGFSQTVQKATSRQSTPRIQHTRASKLQDEPHLYGTITITSKEALSGTRKLVSISKAGRRRFFWVNVPAGTRSGAILRLSGTTMQSETVQGDIYLNVNVIGNGH
jgi:membrane associated rhomboid family serine protease